MKNLRANDLRLRQLSSESDYNDYLSSNKLPKQSQRVSESDWLDTIVFETVR